MYSEIKSQQKGPDKSGYVVAYIYRRISIYFSMLFITLGFSPNFITLLSMLSDFFVIYLMYSQHWIWAGILVNMGLVLDASDGEVARYLISKGKKEKGKRFGGYLDMVIGTIGFTLLIFFAGYFMNELWAGFFAMFGLFMIIVAAVTAKADFPDKLEIAKKFQTGLLGKMKGKLGFACGEQRILISLAVLFQSALLLWVFAGLAAAFFTLKIWVYRNQ